MPFARLAVAAAIAAAAVVPATADAVLVCVHPNTPDETYVCKDTARPECLGYGAVAGVEFALGTYCH